MVASDRARVTLVHTVPAADRLPEVFVVWMSGRVLLMVDGLATSMNEALVSEMRSSLMASGVADEDIDVLWSPVCRPQGTSL